jgi:hypothetical protein
MSLRSSRPLVTAIFRAFWHACGTAADQVVGSRLVPRLLAMDRDLMDPEDCLRSLTAEALLRAHPDRPSSVMTVERDKVLSGAGDRRWLPPLLSSLLSAAGPLRSSST